MKKNLLTYKTLIDYKLSPRNLNNPLLKSSTATLVFQKKELKGTVAFLEFYFGNGKFQVLQCSLYICFS